jgi:Plasmid pRiA4b ORF-3-like protein
LSRHHRLPPPGGDRRDQPADLAAAGSGRRHHDRRAARHRAGLFGWSGEHLHRFVIGGTEYGISYLGGPGFRDDARQVRLADLRLREGERFVYEYNFSAAWRVDLRVEQIACAQPGGPIRGARAGGARARPRTGMARGCS